MKGRESLYCGSGTCIRCLFWLAGPAQQNDPGDADKLSLSLSFALLCRSLPPSLCWSVNIPWGLASRLCLHTCVISHLCCSALKLYDARFCSPCPPRPGHLACRRVMQSAFYFRAAVTAAFRPCRVLLTLGKWIIEREIDSNSWVIGGVQRQSLNE